MYLVDANQFYKLQLVFHGPETRIYILGLKQNQHLVFLA